MSEDRIYADQQLGQKSGKKSAQISDDKPFRFDETVVKVFPDMLRRSIPGYVASLEAIGSLAARYVQANSRCYDLGCSLGAATLAMRHGIQTPGCRIIAIDNSEAMIKRCREVVAQDDASVGTKTDVEIQLGDLRDVAISNASMVVLNYTLQFVDAADRATIIQTIYDGLLPGGLLVLSEKVVDEDPDMEALLIDLYHEHKRRNDYSALEVARKRAALENVLIPETVSVHRARLEKAGFKNIAVWLRYFNFVSIIAIKQ